MRNICMNIIIIDFFDNLEKRMFHNSQDDLAHLEQYHHLFDAIKELIYNNNEVYLKFHNVQQKCYLINDNTLYTKSFYYENTNDFIKIKSPLHNEFEYYQPERKSEIKEGIVYDKKENVIYSLLKDMSYKDSMDYSILPKNQSFNIYIHDLNQRKNMEFKLLGNKMASKVNDYQQNCTVCFNPYNKIKKIEVNNVDVEQVSFSDENDFSVFFSKICFSSLSLKNNQLKYEINKGIFKSIRYYYSKDKAVEIIKEIIEKEKNQDLSIGEYIKEKVAPAIEMDLLTHDRQPQKLVPYEYIQNQCKNIFGNIYSSKDDKFNSSAKEMFKDLNIEHKIKHKNHFSLKNVIYFNTEELIKDEKLNLENLRMLKDNLQLMYNITYSETLNINNKKKLTP